MEGAFSEEDEGFIGTIVSANTIVNIYINGASDGIAIQSCLASLAIL